MQVIDVGIGVERIPWLISGSPTSYVDVCPSGLKYLLSNLNLELNSTVEAVLCKTAHLPACPFEGNIQGVLTNGKTGGLGIVILDRSTVLVS